MVGTHHHSLLLYAIITFALLSIAGVVMALIGVAVENTAGRELMIGIGSAILGGSLAFFLMQLFEYEKTRLQVTEPGAAAQPRAARP
jgi:hypothetical protein